MANPGLPLQLDLPRRLRDVAAIDARAGCLQVDGRWFSWGDLSTASDRLQAILDEHGLGQEAMPLGVVMRNSAATVATLFSIVIRRQTIVTLIDVQPNDRLAESLGDLPVVAFVAHPQDWTDAFTDAARTTGALCLSVSPEAPSEYEVVLPLRLDAAETRRRARPGIAVEMLTSGTTGPPKRVPLSYEQLAVGIASASHYGSANSDQLRLHRGVAVVALPLLHMAGLWTTLFNFANGRPVAMLPRFETDAWILLIREHRPLVANIPPAALQMLMERNTPPEALSSLRALTVGTAPVSPNLAERFEARYGIAVLTVYGATEFAGGVAGWTLADRERFAREKRGSVGRAHHDVELQVVDPETGVPLPPGETGLLGLRAPQLRAESPDGWMRTNDLASVDEDGFLWIRGRADDVIIRGGFKISAGQVAEVLRSHPAVRDAAVVGIPHDRLGAVPVAAVELDLGASSAGDEDVLRDWCARHLASYQIPTRIFSVPALPRGAVLKVSDAAVRDLINERLGYD